MLLSPAEVSFIQQGIEQGIRADGRKPTDQRACTMLETSVIPQASGSCFVRIGATTTVLVGIRAEIGAIEAENGAELDQDEQHMSDEQAALEHEETSLNRGRVVCHIDCSQSAVRVYDNRKVEALCEEYSHYLTRLLNGDQGGLDLTSLCIIPNSTCWILYVDALVLDFGGNLLDAVVLATRAALCDTRIPLCIVEELDGKFEFNLGDQEDQVLQGWRHVPVTVTLYKIGSRFVADANVQEDMCTDVKVTVAVNRSGHICSIQKSSESSLEPSLLIEMIQTAKQLGVTMIQNMDKALANEEQRVYHNKAAIGFINY